MNTMNTMYTMNTKKEAKEIYIQAEDAMIDLAVAKFPNTWEFQEMEKEAEKLWNNPEILRRFIGDKIFWSCCSFKTERDREDGRKLCSYLKYIGHDAMKEAVQDFERSHFLDGINIKINDLTLSLGRRGRGKITKGVREFCFSQDDTIHGKDIQKVFNLKPEIQNIIFLIIEDWLEYPENPMK